jgi:hypothetical protein
MIIQKNTRQVISAGIIVLIFLLAGCSPNSQRDAILATTIVPTPAYTTSPSPFHPTQNSLVSTLTPEETLLAAETLVWHEPAGCLKPPEDYTLVTVNGWLLNKRTVAMLKQAMGLYSGQIDIIGSAITQGSYHDNGAASFGTHLGGGAVDLSVISIYKYEILTEEIEPLVYALRVAGFAAWYREPGGVYPGSAPHIHAIAIGDQQLSDAARLQLIGPTGYFGGFDGLPVTDQPPAPDPHGGPVLCGWMADMGYLMLTAVIPLLQP